MTRLTVLGSGSRGNAFALEHDGSILLIDAGFSRRELERRLKRAELDPTAVVGIALTHEHGDHASGATSFARSHQAAILTSLGTWRALADQNSRCEYLPIGLQREAVIGPFTLTGCPTSHDATEPIAVGVRLPTGLSLAAAYDLGCATQAIKWFLRGRHALILEANHDDTLLRNSTYPLMVQQRISGPDGHLSNQDAARLLTEVAHDQLEMVVLAHLSQRCNAPEIAYNTITTALQTSGYQGIIRLAEQSGPMEPIQLHGPAQPSLL